MGLIKVKISEDFIKYQMIEKVRAEKLDKFNALGNPSGDGMVRAKTLKISDEKVRSFAKNICGNV